MGEEEDSDPEHSKSSRMSIWVGTVMSGERDSIAFGGLEAWRQCAMYTLSQTKQWAKHR
jgi:hypothetical protein